MMVYTVHEAIEKLEYIANQNPDAKLKIDPPYSDLRSITYRSDTNIVELDH